MVPVPLFLFHSLALKADSAAPFKFLYLIVKPLLIIYLIALKLNDVTSVRVTYYTTSEARAMNWLTKE